MVADLEAWEKQAGIKVGSGDAILLHTGRWLRRAKEGPTQGAYAGFHASTLPWLKVRDVAVIGTDGGLDVYPSGVPDSGAPVHTLVLTALGMPILDVMDLTAVSVAAAERKRWTEEFLADRGTDARPERHGIGDQRDRDVLGLSARVGFAFKNARGS